MRTKGKKMLAFHDDPKIRSKYLRRVRAHAKADEIVKGQYWEDGRGCAVGCTIHGSRHADYETELGIPIELAYLEDWLFENLPNGESKTWPDRFLSAIRTGADLSLVYAKFSHWLLVDEKDGVVRFSGGGAVEKAVRDAAALWARSVRGEAVGVEEWSAAESAARSAAWSAAESAARSAAESAAWSAARSAVWSAARSAVWSAAESAAWSAAWSAARSAVWSAAESAARSAAVIRQSEKLLDLLKESA